MQQDIHMPLSQSTPGGLRRQACHWQISGGDPTHAQKMDRILCWSGAFELSLLPLLHPPLALGPSPVSIYDLLSSWNTSSPELWEALALKWPLLPRTFTGTLGHPDFICQKSQSLKTVRTLPDRTGVPEALGIGEGPTICAEGTDRRTHLLSP